jgi:hypothetical protein
MSNDDLIEKIKADIERTGFSSEMKVSSILLNKGWEKTANSLTYNDKDFDISREIDIFSVKEIHDETKKQSIRVSLVIEVKNSNKNHWIVFCRDKLNIEKSEPGKRLLISSHITKKLTFTETDINNKNLYYLSEFIGTNFHEFTKKPNENSQIYKALLSSCKASTFYNEIYNTSFKQSAQQIINFVLPVVVFDGKLFKTTFDTQNNIQVDETDYIPVQLFYSSQHYSNSKFFIDIITIDYLKTYLDKIDIWLNDMYDNCKIS